MKTKYWVICLAALLVICLGLSLVFLAPGAAATHAQITSDGQILRTVNLGIDQEFTVTSASGGTNTVTIQQGKIAVTQATCPDHYCMKRGFCHSGADIVCLPNRLVIHFTEAQEIDAVIG